MGSMLSALFSRFYSKKLEIVLVGLENRCAWALEPGRARLFPAPAAA